MSITIPRTFHRIWLGDQAMPDEYERFGDTWRFLHPGWEMRLWTDATLPPLKNAWAYAQPRSLSAKCNIARYEILLQHGGIYVDTDFECLKNVESLLQDIECFVAWEREGLANNAIIGAVPGHPFLRDLVDSLEENVRKMPDADPSVTQSGPYYLTNILGRHPEVTVFPASLFYPYQWHERWRRYEAFPDAYAVHHWSMTWRATKWPQPRQLGDGTLPCLSVVIDSCNDSLRLEWVLEGLCVQTVSDFEVIVVSRAGDMSIERLIHRFEDRLNITHATRKSRRKQLRPAEARNMGLRFARAARTLFLDGDCLPDTDVVEAHAKFGSTGFVPFGFRRIYPADKLYPFMPPLDYLGFQNYVADDPRHSFPMYGDWRDVQGFCLSAPTDVVCQLGGFGEKLSGDSAQDLAWRLSRQKYRLIPMWSSGYVTYLDHAKMSSTSQRKRLPRRERVAL